MTLKRRSKHCPNRFSNYLKVHTTVIDQFKARDFIGSENLSFQSLDKNIFLEGEIACLGRILVTVHKKLKIVDHEKQLVQTSCYAYNASIQGAGNLFRYDNQDEDFAFRPGHKDEHHRHDFDWKTDTECIDSPKWIGVDGWLTLGEVIQELSDWYWKSKEDLPFPDDYAVLGLRDRPPSLEL